MTHVEQRLAMHNDNSEDHFMFRRGEGDIVKANHNKERELSGHEEEPSYDSYLRREVVSKRGQWSPNFNDPLLNDQWYLHNRGQTGGKASYDHNIYPVWKRNITGAGITACILDDGVQHKHPDLKKNFDPRASLDLDEPSKGHDPSPRGDQENSHGTKCAGTLAAEANNGVCGVGVAYNANIGGVRVLDGDVTDLLESRAAGFNCDYIDIYSASWGPTDDGKTMAAPGRYLQKAIYNCVTKGRDGKGNVYVWATGNGGEDGDDCNADGFVSNPHVISIGSINEKGEVPFYMELCASTMAVVFTGGPSRTDIKHREMNKRGDSDSIKPNIKVVSTTINGECTESFMGTSAAAPLAAGIFALVLQANPNLTYRDIKHIISHTANIPDYTISDWKVNGAGFHLNRQFGFGRLDAGRMVELAQKWTNVAPVAFCEQKEETTFSEAIPIGGSVSVDVENTGCAGSDNEVKYLEEVLVHVKLTAERRGDINLTITCPEQKAGLERTQSVILGNRPADDNSKGINFSFMTTHCWGENPSGKWTLTVSDDPQDHKKKRTKAGKLLEVSLSFYGTTVAPPAGDSLKLSGMDDTDPHMLKSVADAETKQSARVEIKSVDGQQGDAADTYSRREPERKHHHRSSRKRSHDVKRNWN